MALDYAAQTPTWRQFDPYGNTRGQAVAWVDNRGFLDQPTDVVTGLTFDGACEYDPVTGRFVSLDTELRTDDPLSLNGYGYTNGDPVNEADSNGAS